jgi:hypothetical protein
MVETRLGWQLLRPVPNPPPSTTILEAPGA